MLYIYIFLFYVLGIILWFTKKYDIITISIIYVILAIFLIFTTFEIFLYLILFFGIAEIITMILNKNHEKRTYKNLFGNCLAGSFFAVLGLPYVCIASIGAAFADTISSEIGRLSKKKPKLITNFKDVEKGVNGGITILGLLGALTVSVFTFIFFHYIFKYDFKIVLIISGIAFVGSIIDSYVGAILENKLYIDNNQTNFIATFFAGILALIIFLFI